MAADNRKSVTEKAKSTHASGPVSTYTIAELTKAHKIFNASHEIVAVALKLAGVERATVEEAKKLIEEFKNKEVK